MHEVHTTEHLLNMGNYPARHGQYLESPQCEGRQQLQTRPQKRRKICGVVLSMFELPSGSSSEADVCWREVEAQISNVARHQARHEVQLCPSQPLKEYLGLVDRW